MQTSTRSPLQKNIRIPQGVRVPQQRLVQGPQRPPGGGGFDALRNFVNRARERAHNHDCTAVRQPQRPSILPPQQGLLQQALSQPHPNWGRFFLNVAAIGAWIASIAALIGGIVTAVASPAAGPFGIPAWLAGIVKVLAGLGGFIFATGAAIAAWRDLNYGDWRAGQPMPSDPIVDRFLGGNRDVSTALRVLLALIRGALGGFRTFRTSSVGQTAERAIGRTPVSRQWNTAVRSVDDMSRAIG